MRLLSTARDYLDAAVTNSGPGLKSMLLDAEAMSAVSVAYPQSQAMAKGIYIFEKLEDARSRDSRQSLPYVTCIVVLSPTEYNVSLLRSEVGAPRFGRYHLYFTGHLANAAIKVLAEADTHEVVASVNEIPLGFRPVDDHIFLGAAAGTESAHISTISSIIDCLGVKPELCYAKASTACRSLASNLSKYWRASGRADSPGSDRSSKVVVVIFDRRLDPVTPLLNQWTYQAMIHEAFGIRNNVVTVGDQSGKKTVITVSPDDDEFFRVNLYKNFGEIGEIIRALVARYQERISNHQGIESVADIKDFISNYPEFQKMSGTVSKHVNLLAEISRFVTSNSLLDVSECEQGLANKSGDVSDSPSVVSVLSTKTALRKVDVLRLLALHFVNKDLNVTLESQEVNIACRTHGIPRREIEQLFRNLRDFAMLDCLNQRNTIGGVDQLGNNFLKNSKKIFRGLRGTENVFTQHEPVIAQILTSLVKTHSSPYLNFDPTCSYSTPNVIAYFLGGITYEEAKAVRDLNASLGSNIVLGGDRIWRSEEFIESFLDEKK